MIRPGLCSVTFRQLAPERVVELSADAGLEVIEWGGDVHVPPGDPDRAAEVARVTTDAGLAVCSYGSYFRSGADEPLTPILDSASALGADRVRIWAGRVDSADATPGQYAQIASRLRDATAEASERSIALALEFHRGTVADTPQAALRLIADVPGLTTYWQPTVDAPDAVALAEYDALAAHVSAVHVFSWWPFDRRLRLDERKSLWHPLFAAAAANPAPPRDALIEFVPDDDPELLASEAATLRRWLDGG
ncbi:sugar phosphate isomerase/epimerase family protein [Microbacterium esteraromaticum]|uniref:sugar phosphate isomerase/epimerase family protein n=1 Tax=Microbacterium esteraromaticum TaxID=57043 RepID=UPI001958A3E3|nr:TIM barrel protein [Microbacterium esteraromaticum]MBM7465589.1 sugar phosphate isomerase/epimerase [Microbacterium esteraromaticum]